MEEEALLERITSFYLTSGDFNGIPLRQVYELVPKEKTDPLLKRLLSEEKISVVYGDGHPNPYIRALPDHHSPAKQAELLDGDLAEQACVYPLTNHLEKVIGPHKFADEPYKRELALGNPQLAHRAFDLSVLEMYRNDPRYIFETDDVFGSLSVKYKYSDGGKMREEDQVFLQSFGFAYDDALNKYVAVFLWDLFKLSPDHQRLWKQKEVKCKTDLHPDYLKSAIGGQWTDHGSIYSAFIEELRTINAMCKAMERPGLFKQDYADTNPPTGFSSLLRPTAKEYYEFAGLLDKLLSENINKDFFQNEVAIEEEKAREDGKIEVTQKGTLRLLSEWITSKFRPVDPAPMEQIFVTFKKVRKLRQKPAHALYENDFDQKYIHEQRKLMLDVYRAVRCLRLVLANHPKARDVPVPVWLKEGKIWTK
jgi:hypothetical protein